MKRLIRWISLLSLIIIACLGLFGWNQPGLAATISTQPVPLLAVTTELPSVSDAAVCPEFEQKIDLNNANIVAFKDCQGFYPNLASLIIKGGPYQTVEDVLEIPGLGDRQKALLQSQLKNFSVSEPIVPLEMRMPPRPMMR
jgi:photosystem II PsbU protein